MSRASSIESTAPAPVAWVADTAPRPRRRSSRPASDSLRTYLQELGAVDLLDAATEARLARQMRRARGDLARLAREVPDHARTDVLRGLDPGRRAAAWTPGEIDRFLARLEARAVRSRDAALVDLLSRARRARRRYDRARRTMILANLKLVVHIAKRYSNSGVPLLDLIQDGNIGLLSAVDKFEPQRGNRFSTYAYWWIKQAIDRSIADRGRLIRIPVHLGDQRRKVARSIAELKQYLHREPSPREIALQSGLPLRKIDRVLGLAREPISLDNAGEERNDPLESVEEATTPSPFREAARHELRDKIREALHALQPREEEIIRLRFGIDRAESHTLEEIGDRLDLSRERIRQIQAAAMRKLHDVRVLESLLEFGGVH